MTDAYGGRAKVTLKLATSLDGRIATAAGESQWITGEAARAQGHRLRADHDAVLVGSQTVLDDDPLLTVRAPAFAGPQPARLVADARLRTPVSSRLAMSAAAHARPTVIMTASADDDVRRAFVAKGVTIFDADAALGGGLALTSIFDACETFGLKTILLEGGGALAASFLRAGVVDRVEWFRAPILLGGEARPAVGGLTLDRLADAPRFKRLAVRELDADLWETYVPSAVALRS